MGEGWVGAALGSEEEKPEGEGPEGASAAPSGAEAFAAAVVAIASRQDPGVARQTEQLLRVQSRLLTLQTKFLADEHSLRLAHLRNQLLEQRMRRSGLWLRVAVQALVALVAIVAGAAILLMLRDAFAARSVVVESFEVPPALAARGVTGKVAASGLLDELRRLQQATRADAAKRELSNAWAGEITLEVPEAGISYSEMSRLLKARLGHDLHIDGELVQGERGELELTVRGDGIAPRTFSGSASELGKLTTDAAGYVYAESQPVLWAYYLLNRGQNEEAARFSRAALVGADKADRPYLLNTWGTATASLGEVRDALRLYRAALTLKSDYWVAHNNVINSLWALGDEEGAWRAGEEMRRIAGGRPGRAPETYYQNIDVLTWDLERWRDATLVDADASEGLGSNVGTSAQPNLADVDVRLHDLAAADIALQTLDQNPEPSDAALSHFVRGRMAAETGDTLAAVTELEAFGTAFNNPMIRVFFPGYSCWIAPAEEAAHRPDKADAILAAGGTYVDCYRFRGDILDGRGDWAGAQKAYAAAVALAPDLPAGYYSWGLALARHGDLRAAEVKFQSASEHGPHWADPLKAWGDVMMRQGRSQEARAKYDEARRYAPTWAALQQAARTVL